MNRTCVSRITKKYLKHVCKRFFQCLSVPIVLVVSYFELNTNEKKKKKYIYFLYILSMLLFFTLKKLNLKDFLMCK